MPDYSPYQQKIIQRYYDNYDTIGLQRLAELATDLYLVDGKKRAAAWKKAEAVMQKMKVPADRIQYILSTDDPVQLANLVKELGTR